MREVNFLTRAGIGKEAESMGRMSSAERKVDLEYIEMKRNPYLADYTEYKRMREQRTPRYRRGVSQYRREASGTRTAQPQRIPQNPRPSQPVRRPAPEERRAVQWQAESTASGRAAQKSRVQRQAESTASGRAAQKSRVQRQAENTTAGRPVRSSSVKKRRAARRRRLLYRKIALLAAAGCVAAVLLGGVFALKNLLQEAAAGTGEVVGTEQTEGFYQDAQEGGTIQGLSLADYGTHPTWTEDFLTPNEYSRPGEPLEEVNSIFVHYTANKGTSAAQNRSYFESLKDTHETSASAHFIIGYEGEIIQCVPLDEIAYAVQTRNYDSVSIECCYLESDGSFTQETYDSLLRLLRWLMEVYDLDKEDILRHYDCGGKKCPLYYTENPEEWEQLKREL